VASGSDSVPDERSYKSTVEASEILAKIEKGEDVEYDGYIIKGNLDISSIKLPEEDGKPIVKSKIVIINSEVDGFARFANVIFKEQIDFSNTIFNGEDEEDGESPTYEFCGAIFSRGQGPTSDFSGAIFSDDAYFVGAKFWYANFDNAKFSYASFNYATFDDNTYFSDATFGGNIYFIDAEFKGDAYFHRAVFNSFACFIDTKFGYEDFIADFRGAIFGDGADFLRATFRGSASFHGAIFSDETNFRKATFSMSADFRKATFSSFADFSDATFRNNIDFDYVTFGDVKFAMAKFNGDTLTFRMAKFAFPNAQEDACRRAKNVLAKAGNRDEEEYHFYREMEAKRVQKGNRKYWGDAIDWNLAKVVWKRNREYSGVGLRALSYVFFETDKWSWWGYLWYDGVEWIFAQLMFGYGVYPKRLAVSWFVIVLLFTGLYYSGQILSDASKWDYLTASFGTAIAPGYIAVILNKIDSQSYQAAAMVETLLGTLLWAGFIATFAKKYMR
jgi:uncharacterized protein YjbI with pentapeptide repeats